MNDLYFCFYLLSIPSKTVNVKRTVNRILHHCPFLHTGLHHGQKEAVEICSVLDVQCGDWPESQTICTGCTTSAGEQEESCVHLEGKCKIRGKDQQNSGLKRGI